MTWSSEFTHTAAPAGLQLGRMPIATMGYDSRQRRPRPRVSGRGRAGAVWGAWTLGKIKQLRTYSRVKVLVCSFPNVLSIVPDRNSIRADDEELCRTMTVGLGRPFEHPIKFDGGELVALRDAGEYIAALPKKEHDTPEWRAAMEALLLVVERGGPTLFARTGSCGCGH